MLALRPAVCRACRVWVLVLVVSDVSVGTGTCWLGGTLASHFLACERVRVLYLQTLDSRVDKSSCVMSRA